MAHIYAQNLHKTFGQREVVKGVSVDLDQGEIVGLLGPNGAGKTTTFYMITGIIKPTVGTVLVDDKPITGWPLYARARIGLSYLPQESSIFRSLTVLQNLMIILEHTKLSRKEQKLRAQELMDDFGITRLSKTLAMHLSGGERRRLEIARALIRNPKFILLDEPFAGIDPIAVGDIQQLIVALQQRGIGVLISDHNVRETLRICHRAYLVNQGEIFIKGTPDAIIADAKARELYLGENFQL